MGRGRKGVLKQSNKAKATGGLRGRRGDPPGIFLSGPKPEDNKVLINEDTLDFMKKHEPTRACRFSFVKRRLARQNIMRINTSGCNITVKGMCCNYICDVNLIAMRFF